MLITVLGFKTNNRRKAVPKVLYLGHSRKAAKAVKVPADCLFIESQYITPGFSRRWSKSKVEPAGAPAVEAPDTKADSENSLSPTDSPESSPELPQDGSPTLSEPSNSTQGGSDATAKEAGDVDRNKDTSPASESGKPVKPTGKKQGKSK